MSVSNKLQSTRRIDGQTVRPSGRSRRIRVAHLIPAREGAVWATEMMQGLAAKGYDLLAVIDGDEGGLARRLDAMGIPAHVVPLKSWNLPLSLTRLVRLLRRERVDIVHTHLYRGQILGRIASRVARVPALVTMVAGPWQLEVPVLAAMDRLTSWLDDVTVSSSQYTLDLYKGWNAPEQRHRLIYYGPNAEKFNPETADGTRVREELGIPPTAPVVGLVAYFYPPKRFRMVMPPATHGCGIKGHEYAIRAAAMVRSQRPDVRFVFVGGAWGGQRGEQHLRSLKRLVSELGLEETVLFAGFRRDIADTLASFDIALQCSLSENLGGTIEALLMERPMIVSRVGGMTDSVIDGKTGLLVPPKDPPALADAVLQLLDNPAKGRELGRNGRQLMLQRFTLEKTVEDVDQLYQGLIRKKQFEPVQEHSPVLRTKRTTKT